MRSDKKEKNVAARRGGNRKKRQVKKKKKRLLRMFFVFLILFVAVIWGADFVYSKFGGGLNQNKQQSENPENSDENTKKEKLELNVAIFGVDKDETRTDVIFVVHFDSELKKISLLSVPRDTKVDIAPEVKKIYDENDRYYQSPTKINAVHAYGGKNGVECAVLQLEDLLGVEIDHYVKFDMDAVVEFVDAFGGVDFYVPMDMYWDMRDTGDILIDLDEGMQHIDGEKALQLLRFRHGYAQQDIERIQTQQNFMNALFEKVTNTENIMKNLPDILMTTIKYVKTDIGVSDAIKYSKYINEAAESKVTMDTVPGVGEPVYYILDEEGLKETVDKVFYNKMPEGEEEVEKAPYESSFLKIEIANGGTTTGLAGEKKDMLTELGYNVVAISTYNGDKTNNTRIVVREEGVGEDLLKYFDNAQLVVDDSLIGNEYDVKIILGLDEK